MDNKVNATAGLEVHTEKSGAALEPRKEADAHLAAERYDQALASWSHILEQDPDHPHALAGKASALVGLKRIADATPIILGLMNADTFHPSSLIRLGCTLATARYFLQAIDVFQNVLRNMPASADVLNHLGAAQLGAQQASEAIYSFRRAVILNQTSAAPHCNMALAFYSLNRIPEAVAASRRALAIEPSSPVAHFNLGCFLLAQGEYAEGWAFYRLRFAKKPARIRHEAQPWVGDPLDGKKLLVLGEQTNGDYVQFVRYVLELVDLGATVSMLAPKRLHRFMSTVPCPITFIDGGVDGAGFDYQCPLFDIPHYLGLLGRGQPPARIPYLSAEAERVEYWRERIGTQGFRIAIAWEGSRPNGDDFGRSFPLEALWPVCKVPGVRLISLQWRSGVDQIATLPPGMAVETLGDAFESDEHGFLDAAAVMKCVDLVITLDSALAHVAGAVGCPTWIALCHAPEWRWQRGRDDSPWYPTARLFRQGAPGDWDGVFARMADALRERIASGKQPAAIAATRSTDAIAPLAPVSYGEVFDKITILEIKAQHVRSPGALDNVTFELGQLRSVVASMGDLDAELLQSVDELGVVNRKLWDVEDALRVHEASHSFGDEFVALARSVYVLNDQRSAHKRRINAILNSPIVEQKVFSVES